MVDLHRKRLERIRFGNVPARLHEALADSTDAECRQSLATRRRTI